MLRSLAKTVGGAAGSPPVVLPSGGFLAGVRVRCIRRCLGCGDCQCPQSLMLPASKEERLIYELKAMERLMRGVTDGMLAFGRTPSMGTPDPAAATIHANFQC